MLVREPDGFTVGTVIFAKAPSLHRCYLLVDNFRLLYARGCPSIFCTRHIDSRLPCTSKFSKTGVEKIHSYERSMGIEADEMVAE